MSNDSSILSKLLWDQMTGGQLSRSVPVPSEADFPGVT